MEKCSIIIPARNESDAIESCLKSLRNIDFPRKKYEIIVVDNGSTDNTAEIIRCFPEVTYLKEEKRGASFARNKGIIKAKGEILVFLDADTRVTEKWLTFLLEPFGDEKIGATGGAIYPSGKNNVFSQYLGVSLFLNYPCYGKERSVRGYPSCNLAVRKKLVPDGFDTSLFSTYFEDKDLCYKIINKGYEVVYRPEAIVYHRHPETFRELTGLMVKSSEGRAAFSKKWGEAPDIILLNVHFPLIYAIALLIPLLYRNPGTFLIIALPALIYFLWGSIISFIRSKKFALSFFVKPALDVVSIFVIYASYHYYKLRR
ncbi:MAG: glycosyltransferase [Candidatus Omnitrophota bacterium]